MRDPRAINYELELVKCSLHGIREHTVDIRDRQALGNAINLLASLQRAKIEIEATDGPIDRTLAWLDYWRDQIPDNAVAQLQSALAGKDTQ